MDTRTGRIVKWVADKGWGIINSYAVHSAPEKFFVHFSNCASRESIAVGVKVSFTPGPPRSANELPVALQVEIVGGAQ